MNSNPYRPPHSSEEPEDVRPRLRFGRRNRRSPVEWLIWIPLLLIAMLLVSFAISAALVAP